MSTSDPGPGVQWLAQRSGRRVEELLEDHVGAGSRAHGIRS
jgi:hypothetical protein